MTKHSSSTLSGRRAAYVAHVFFYAVANIVAVFNDVSNVIKFRNALLNLFYTRSSV